VVWTSIFCPVFIFCIVRLFVLSFCLFVCFFDKFHVRLFVQQILRTNEMIWYVCMYVCKAVHCTTVQPAFIWQSSSSRALNAPEKASLHTLQYMGRACDVEYQRWFPERKSWWSPAWKERDGNTATILWLLTNRLSSAAAHVHRIQWRHKQWSDEPWTVNVLGLLSLYSDPLRFLSAVNGNYFTQSLTQFTHSVHSHMGM
jgi:hypothetical protein